MTAVAKTKRKRGRQLRYTDELAQQLCRHLEDGKPAAEFQRANGICAATLWNWRQQFPQFAEMVARARDLGHDTIADDCMLIANNCPNDADHVAAARLKIETRLKLLACWDPKRYGQRNTQDNAISVTVNVVDPTAHLVTVGAIDHAPQARLIPQDGQREHTRVAQVSDQASEQADSRHRTG
jgi:transposase-like protein